MPTEKLKLYSSKITNKPRVKIVHTPNGNAYAVWAEDTFKPTKEPFGWQVFAYVWAVTPRLMCKALHSYMEMKGIRN